MFRPLGWNLQQVVRQALLLAESKAGMKHIVLREQIDEKLTVSADKEMLDLILRNLLSNAIKFTGIGGWIEIGADLDKDRIVVTIRDNGEGMDEETMDMLRRADTFIKVLDPEQSVGHARFGLMLTREFIAIHGGICGLTACREWEQRFSLLYTVQEAGWMSLTVGKKAKRLESYFGRR